MPTIKELNLFGDLEIINPNDVENLHYYIALNNLTGGEELVFIGIVHVSGESHLLYTVNQQEQITPITMQHFVTNYSEVRDVTEYLAINVEL